MMILLLLPLSPLPYCCCRHCRLCRHRHCRRCRLALPVPSSSFDCCFRGAGGASTMIMSSLLFTLPCPPPFTLLPLSPLPLLLSLSSSLSCRCCCLLPPHVTVIIVNFVFWGLASNAPLLVVVRVVYRHAPPSAIIPIPPQHLC